MHAVVRNYSGKGAKELFDILEKNKAEVERLIRGVKGFVSYSMVRNAVGGFTVSIYQDKSGTDESLRWHGIGLLRMPATLALPPRPSRKEW